MRALAFAAMVLAAAVAEAQSITCGSPAVTYLDYWCARLKEIRPFVGQQGGLQEIEKLIRLQGFNLKAFLLYAQARGESADLRAIEDARIDKQVGAPGNSAGSSSAVSKGAVPSILGFAVENGALTQETSKTAVTLRGNLVGWLDLIESQGFVEAFQDDSPFVRQLRRVSYSLTLNTDTTDAGEAAVASGAGGLSPAAIKEQLRSTGQQLAGYSVRFAIWDQRDPRLRKNREAAASLVGPAMDAVLKSDNFLNDVLNSNEYNFEWIPATAMMLRDTTLDDTAMARVWYRQLEIMRRLMVNRIDHFDDRVLAALAALDSFDSARVKAFKAMQRQPLIAAEFVNAREKDLPDKSTLRFIAEGQWGPRLDLTANVAWTLQRPVAPAPGDSNAYQTRDFQAAAQMEVPLANPRNALMSSSGIGAPSLAVAYLSQRLSETATVTFAGNSFTLEEGWIHVVQAKVTIPVKGSGMKIPLSVSFANRTELIKEKNLRGNIGLTFDLDVLSSLRR